jgi:hypothetical protein
MPNDMARSARRADDRLSVVPNIENFVRHSPVPGFLRIVHNLKSGLVKPPSGGFHTGGAERSQRNFIDIRADRARLELSLESRRKFCTSNLPVFASTSRQGSRVCERPILLEPTPGCRTGAGGFTTHGGSSWAFPPFFPGSSPRSPGVLHAYSFGSPDRWITDGSLQIRRPTQVACPIQAIPVQDRVTSPHSMKKSVVVAEGWVSLGCYHPPSRTPSIADRLATRPDIFNRSR